MSYDDVKEFHGQTYTGMSVGGEHSWDYTDAVWRERKVAPDKWDFAFTSVKRRHRSAPEGSGPPPETQYRWYLLAHQFVRKIDADAYATFMEGVKYKIAHKRPHWRKWSTEYHGPTERGKIAAILEETLAALRGEIAVEPPEVIRSDVGPQPFVTADALLQAE